MVTLKRFGISIEEDLLDKFDKLIASKGYENRSEAFRDIARDLLVKQKWSDPNAEAVGTITIIYDHHKREISDKLTEFQHHHHVNILSAMHIHLDEKFCLEVIALRGKVKDIQHIADHIIGTKGVKHGKLTATTIEEFK
ncbi:MAG: nickel-responsive transcriptional regulator NikR [Bacteroidetes bacterium]|nr:nickel-responsive transcriptional regulator NikR [Bacteroidota bacterium]